MDKKVLKEVVEKGGAHLASLVASNAKNIEAAYEDVMIKSGGSAKATCKVNFHLNLQKNLEGGAGGVKVSAGISGGTTFKDSTAPETIDTNEKLPGM